jgi:hypothetical protein
LGSNISAAGDNCRTRLWLGFFKVYKVLQIIPAAAALQNQWLSSRHLWSICAKEPAGNQAISVSATKIYFV